MTSRDLQYEGAVRQYGRLS